MYPRGIFPIEQVFPAVELPLATVNNTQVTPIIQIRSISPYKTVMIQVFVFVLILFFLLFLPLHKQTYLHTHITWPQLCCSVLTLTHTCTHIFFCPSPSLPLLVLFLCHKPHRGHLLPLSNPAPLSILLIHTHLLPDDLRSFICVHTPGLSALQQQVLVTSVFSIQLVMVRRSFIYVSKRRNQQFHQNVYFIKPHLKAYFRLLTSSGKFCVANRF